MTLFSLGRCLNHIFERKCDKSCVMLGSGIQQNVQVKVIAGETVVH